jgi:hypothetical protein
MPAASSSCFTFRKCRPYYFDSAMYLRLPHIVRESVDLDNQSVISSAMPSSCLPTLMAGGWIRHW